MSNFTCRTRIELTRAALHLALDDPDPAVRRDAVAALWEIGFRQSMQRLVRGGTTRPDRMFAESR